MEKGFFNKNSASKGSNVNESASAVSVSRDKFPTLSELAANVRSNKHVGTDWKFRKPMRGYVVTFSTDDPKVCDVSDKTTSVAAAVVSVETVDLNAAIPEVTTGPVHEHGVMASSSGSGVIGGDIGSGMVVLVVMVLLLWMDMC